jgi:uncharacterized protein YajQ (UPF0234 family)
MPSFDIVSEVDIQEVDNAVNNTVKELKTRYDFKDSNTEVVFDRKQSVINTITTDDMKVKALREIIIAQFIKRGGDARSLVFGEVEKAGGAKLKRVITLKSGLDKEHTKSITSIIKTSGLKVTSAIMDDRVRVTGKKIDDLQEIIKLLKTGGPDIPLQFINLKS